MTNYDNDKCPKTTCTSMSNKGHGLQMLGLLEGDYFKLSNAMKSGWW